MCSCRAARWRASRSSWVLVRRLATGDGACVMLAEGAVGWRVSNQRRDGVGVSGGRAGAGGLAMSPTREAGVGGRVEVRFLVGGVLQRVFSGSGARRRSVRRVRQTWVRRGTGECTGEATTLEGAEPDRGPVICEAPSERADSITTFATYLSGNAAREAVAASGADGAEDDVRLLIGRALHDTRRERVGGFAGPVAPDDRVGSFANRVGERRRGCGSFAGDPDRERQGCSADSDRLLWSLSATAPSGLG